MIEDSSQPTLYQQIFNSPQRKTWRIICSLLAFFWVIAMISLAVFIRSHPAFGHSIKLWVVLIGLVFLQIGLLVIVWVRQGIWIPHLQSALDVVFRRLGKANLVVAFLPIAIFLLLVLGNREYAPLLSILWVRIYLLLWSSLAAAVFVSFAFHKPFLLHWFQVTLVFGSFWIILKFIPIQPNYPFSLDWSETSWYYYSSFFIARKIYGTGIPWPFLIIGRPLLLSVPFLFTIRSLAVERIWEFILWLGSAAAVPFFLVRRLHLDRSSIRWWLGVWGFIWILLSPVNYSFTISIIFVLVFFDRKNLFKSIFWVGIATVWASIMRFNWIPVPAMLAIILYLLETSFEKNGSWWKFIRKPFFIGLIDVGLGVIAFLGVLLLTGRADTRFISKFTAPILWYRLFPNGTFYLGILAGALFLASLLLIFVWIYYRKDLVHPQRKALIYLILAILFFGGTYASLKIGGGNNLHNLDAFWVTMLIILFYTITHRVAVEKNQPGGKWIIGFTVLLICIPFLFLMTLYPDLKVRNAQIAQTELTDLQTITRSVAHSGGKVLFISNRHLITFDLVKDVPLVQEYESEELMEMAIAGNDDYIKQFQLDLDSRKYQVIVIGIVNPNIQGKGHIFSEENNAWREDVVLPLLKYYQLTLTLPQSQLEVYQPIQ